MTATLNRWGNSTGVRIPKEALERSVLQLGDDVEIVIINNGIALHKKTKKTLNDIIKPLINTKDWKFDREEANERR
ncbi:MAG: AbrB/MazE/SpoVT family DNA-binding domain-containing protein [Defluviitaleaceae bacterium]|nr:AbrB/MazE/SpoVT family DNA-binding domain-containing protein [Defluviitaleaceae bacterium]